QSFPGGDNKESGGTLGFSVLASDANGDTSSTLIRFRVNDDRPIANSDDAYVPPYIPNETNKPTAIGNVFYNDTGTGDGMRITKFAGIDMPAGVGASISFKTPYGNFIIAADGLYNYESNKSNPDGYSVLYDYFAKDGDGDTTAASLFIHFPSFATHTPEDDFTHVVDVTGDFTATGTS